jgi:predicted transglutaminase-like cysteine proteinase
MKSRSINTFVFAGVLGGVLAAALGVWPLELHAEGSRDLHAEGSGNLHAEGSGAVNKNGLMGSVEIASDDLSALPQWTRVLEKIPQELKIIKKCEADIKDCSSTRLVAWQAKIQEARSLPPLGQLRAINRFINSWPVKDDLNTYGRADHWASPLEFIERSGDSEDFAIIKFFMLRELGFANANLRVVSAMDSLRNKPQAFLAVYMGTDVFVLDNLSNTIQSDQFSRHFVPTYSVNETNRWAHIPARIDGS